MNQEIKRNFGCTTQTGDIIVCNGGTDCPMQKHVDEALRQVEFARLTGIIDCPPTAREELNRLMRDHDFTVSNIAKAWRAKSISWDDKKRRVIARSHWFELVFAGLVLAPSVLFLLAEGIDIALSRRAFDIVEASRFGAVVAIYGGSAWFAVRHIVVPYRVATKARRLLA